MKSGIPWNLKGIDDETRQAVAAAARRAGMSVGEWLNLVLADDGPGYAEPEDIAPSRTTEHDIERQLAALSERLNQLENRPLAAATAASVQQAGNVRELISRLARQIENQDEKARTSVEGLTRRSGFSGGREQHAQRGAVRLDAAVRDLDQRIAALSQRASVSHAAPPRMQTDSAPRLDDIRTRLDALLAKAPQTAAAPQQRASAPLADTALLDAALRSLESRIDEAKAQAATRAAAAANEATNSHITRIEKRLAEISEKLDKAEAERSQPQRDAELAAAIREIAVHQRAIDERAETAEIRREQQALADTMAALRDEIAMLAGTVTSVARLGAEDQGTFFDIARRIDALAADRPQDRAGINALRDDIEAIATQIDGLLARTPDTSRIDALSEEIAGIRRAMEQDDSPRAIQRLEMRLSELGRTIDTTLNARTHTFDPAIERLEGHINDVADRLAASLREATTQTATIDRKLDSRFSSISEQLGSVAEASQHAEAITLAQSHLEERMEEIVAHLAGIFERTPDPAIVEDMQDRLQLLAERIDTLPAQRYQPDGAMDAIQHEIAALREEIAAREAASAPATDHLEAQIQQLAEQLDSIASARQETSGLSALEDQVATLAAELEETRPRTEAIRNVEESLDRLQAMLADTARDTLLSAREEARKVVSELSVVGQPASVDPTVIEGLVRDLESLKAAVAETDRSGSAEASSVSETMSRVVNRLSRLENEASAPVETTPKSWAGAFRSAARQDAVAAPAPEERKTSADRRADFIAAARRAAQAAAAEAQSTSTTSPAQAAATPSADHDPAHDDETRPGAFARISQAIRNRKRPLLVAAAAIVLAIGAMQVYGHVSPAKLTAEAPVAKSTVSLPGTNEHGDILPPATSAEITPSLPTTAITAAAAKPDKALAFAEPVGLDSRFGDGDITGSIANSSFKVPATAQPMPPAQNLLNGDADSIAMAVAADAAAPRFLHGLDTRLGPGKLLEAASSGDPTAAFEIASRYADGEVVPKDLAKAAEWYSRAAEGGVAVAQYRLGSLYERGQGVEQDLEQAVTWYQRAADQGNINAMHNLAVLMSEGVDGTPDHDKALQWFNAAAEHGVRDSQYNLGVIYARGLGMQQDLAESYKWFAVAAAQGDTDAKARRDEVEKAMSADDLARARTLVAAWSARTPLADANTVATPAGGWGDTDSTLNSNDRRSLVAKIQTLLAEQGFDPGPADGQIGPKTVDAVKAYQRQLGQPATGTIDQSFMAALSGNRT